MMAEPAYFFDKGIRFTCTECGQCCTGEPGRVRISREELEALAGHLALSPGELIEGCLVHGPDGFRIREKPNGDCHFFKNNRCGIYDFRPRQCRTFPFWVNNMRSEKAWEKTCARCPGIGEGRHYTRDEILAILQDEPGTCDRPPVS